jgi:hypothetical protein
MQQMSRHNIFISKQPEDTRLELLWKKRYSIIQQRPVAVANRA